jgi:hypothetical protein
MRNKAILISLMLVATGSVLAEQSLLESVAKQAVENKAAEVAPGTIEKVGAANQTLNKAKALKGAAEIAPNALQVQAKDVVKEKAAAVVPAEVKQAGEATEHLKGKVNSVPKPTTAIKNKAKEQVAEKALELVH